MKGDIKGQILLSECPFGCIRCGDGDAAHTARFCISNAKITLARLEKVTSGIMKNTTLVFRKLCTSLYI